MPFSKNAALAQIDAALKRYDHLYEEYKRPSDMRPGNFYISPPDREAAEVAALLQAALDRVAPPGMSYGEVALGDGDLRGRSSGRSSLCSLRAPLPVLVSAPNEWPQWESFIDLPLSRIGKN